MPDTAKEVTAEVVNNTPGDNARKENKKHTEGGAA